MHPQAVLNTALAILIIGILFGTLLGMSGLVLPLVLIAGIVVAGKILLPIIFRKR